MVLTKRTSNLPLICQICGDKARGINFDVMTCMPCKAFFRRHALKSKNFQCFFDSNCNITRVARNICPACRLKKCFSLGMNPTLIRNTSTTSCRLLKMKPQSLPMPLPLNLLQKDSSTLTNSEWNLLSNIIHAYDKNDPIRYTNSLLENQLSLPPKLRSKPTIVLDIIAYFYSTVQSYLQNIPLFNDLSIDARRAVIQHNSDTIGTYNSLYIVRETNAIDNPAYAVGCYNVYGQENFKELKVFVSRLEPNGIIFKIMLLIIGFSGNCSIVTPDYSENLSSIESTISINHVQNILVTMLWKYLIYQYGFLGAIKCFNSFIKFILNILRWAAEGSAAQHNDMVDTLIENTSRSLTMEDSMSD